MSLFGQNATSGSQPATSQASSLFGGLNLPKPAQPSSNLFNNFSQPQPPTTSLFGASPSGTVSQQGLSSLFGTSTAAINGPQQSGAASTGPQANNAGFQPQAAAQQSGAYFDTLLEKSRKRANGNNALDELPSIQLGLGELRDRIKRIIPSAADKGATDGRAHYLLAASGVEPGTAVRDLSYFDTQSKRSQSPQQPALADADLESYIANLQTQTTLSMITEGLSRSVREFDTFLEENASIEWENQRRRIYNHFGIKPRTETRVDQDGLPVTAYHGAESGGFGRSRRSRGAHLGGSKHKESQNINVRERFAMQRSVIGSVGPVGSVQRSPFAESDTKSHPFTTNASAAPSGRFLREKESKFAEKVQHLNNSRIQKIAYPLLHAFSDIEAQYPGEHAQHVMNGYKALVDIVGEYAEPRGSSEPGVPKERQFAKAWVGAAQNSASAIELRKRILKGAGQHLEKQYFQSMESLLSKNPREANLGGVPNVLSKVKAYVRLRAARKDLAPDSTALQTRAGEYVWAIVFYLLRTGHIKEALEYVETNTPLFKAIDRYFPQYLSAFNASKDNRLPPELQNRINNEYSQRFRIAPENSVDPFRMACYKVIGRCDLSDINLAGLQSDLLDWAWLLVTLAREVNLAEEYAGAVFTLSGVQRSVKGLGEALLAKGLPAAEEKTAKGVYFYLQILCGLFEDAVNFFYKVEYADALHFAIALDYYGLLSVSDPSTSDGKLLTTTATDRPQINFAQMIGWYTRDFRAANVFAAVDYLTLICLNHDLEGEAGNRQVSTCHQGLRELVLESREFTKLLGDMHLDGRRIKGAIEERMKLLNLTDTDDFMRAVTIQAASIADDNGRVTDAVLLYHLAGEYDNVITITNRALSEAVALDIGQEKIQLQPARAQGDEAEAGHKPSALSLTSVEDPVELAQRITAIYNDKSMYHEKISSINKETCRVLLRMNEAKSKVEVQNWTGALDIIASLQVLPLEAQGDSNTIRQYAGKYSALPETITRNIPNLIMWTGRSCEEQRNKLVNSHYNSNDGTRRHMINDLKRKAKDLTMYAGFLKYRLPPWVNDMLARIAAD